MTPDQDLSARLGKLAKIAQGDGLGDGWPLRNALHDAYRSGQLITLADHTAAVQAAVAKAVEAERAACAMVLDMDACDCEEDALRFRSGTNPHHSRMAKAETARKYAAAIRARKGAAL